MHKMLGMYGLMLAMMNAGNMSYAESEGYKELTDEEKERLRLLAEKRRINQLKTKGVNEYFYGDHVIYARDKENADRKARNKGLI